MKNSCILRPFIIKALVSNGGKYLKDLIQVRRTNFTSSSGTWRITGQACRWYFKHYLQPFKKTIYQRTNKITKLIRKIIET